MVRYSRVVARRGSAQSRIWITRVRLQNLHVDCHVGPERQSVEEVPDLSLARHAPEANVGPAIREAPESLQVPGGSQLGRALRLLFPKHLKTLGRHIRGVDNDVHEELRLCHPRQHFRTSFAMSTALGTNEL